MHSYDHNKKKTKKDAPSCKLMISDALPFVYVFTTQYNTNNITLIGPIKSFVIADNNFIISFVLRILLLKSEM